MENANQEKEDLSSYNDIISKLQAAPEEQFTDISEKVMSAIKHERAITQQLYKRMLYSGIGVGAAAIALCIGLGFYMSQPSSEAIEQFASVEPKVAPIETVVAESAPTMSIYDVEERDNGIEDGNDGKIAEIAFDLTGDNAVKLNPDGTISTQVYRLPYEDFKPDFGIGGY